METDRLKWNKRFESEDSYLGNTPSPFLLRMIGEIKRLAPGNRALDVACGEGRNAVFLARHGFQVTGLDISDSGIAKGEQKARSEGLTVDFFRIDLQGYTIDTQYDVIINFNFLLRELIAQEVGALSPGGLLLFDTILESPELLASHNPEYLLRKGELKRTFEAFSGEIVFWEESTEGEMPTARILFRKPR